MQDKSSKEKEEIGEHVGVECREKERGIYRGGEFTGWQTRAEETAEG